jgi:hypothetical protein
VETPAESLSDPSALASLSPETPATVRLDRATPDEKPDERPDEKPDESSVSGDDRLSESSINSDAAPSPRAEAPSSETSPPPDRPAQTSDDDRRTPPAPPTTANSAEESPESAMTSESAESSSAASPAAEGFTPANSVEVDLLSAVGGGNADLFLSTLLLAKVLIPGEASDPPNWPTEEIDGVHHLVTYTSRERFAEGHGAEAPAVQVRFSQLIHKWPDEALGFAVNPGTPVGATLSGGEIIALANWAADVGLTGEDEPEPVREPGPPVRLHKRHRITAAEAAGGLQVMQKSIAASQLPYFLERGYDRTSGFVHRANEVIHLRSPAQLYHALGLNYTGTPFAEDDDVVYLLRWTAYCQSLYRIPYGGPNEPAMRAMQGWVVERAPFRGNGFAAGDTGDVIAEFKVDSARLPHGAQLWRLDTQGKETLVALLDADGPRWHRVEEKH